MAIPFALQYFVEKDRNVKFEFLTMMVTMLLPLIHGILFLWIPWFLRSRRDAASYKYKQYFAFVKYFDACNKVYKLTVWERDFFYQPSLLVIMGFHLGVLAWFCFAQTSDITYEDLMYIVAKRVGRISIGCLPMILLFVAKNTVIAALSGLTLDKAVFFHKWLGRCMLLTSILHTWYTAKYWLDLGFKTMVTIPPQIFGFIALGCLAILNVASFKLLRNFAFDLFLVQHRIFNFVMLLLVYFHNSGNHAPVLLGVHLLVLDRICSRVLGIMHKRKGPTKGMSEFEIMDETTVRISIPIKIANSDNHKWWWNFVPRYGNWRAGQHIYLNVFKVAWFQYHPFTIASLADSGKIVIVLKTQKGFTRKLMRKLHEIKEQQDEEHTEGESRGSNEEMSRLSSERETRLSSEVQSRTQTHSECLTEETVDSSSELVKTKYHEVEVLTTPVQNFKEILDSFPETEILQLKAGINGPYGGTYQPLLRFDSVVFFSAGSGASFTLPVALDLLKTIKEREEVNDYLYRPERTAVTIVLVMKKIANLQWYDHLWPEFLPFLNNGRAHLKVHITQEVADAAENEEEIEEQEKSDSDRIRLYLTGNISEKRTTSFGTTSTSSSFEATGFSITYARPDFRQIITEQVRAVSCKEYRKGFACLACGPDRFNGEVKLSCSKNKWVEGAPDIYCYTESFG